MKNPIRLKNFIAAFRSLQRRGISMKFCYRSNQTQQAIHILGSANLHLRWWADLLSINTDNVSYIVNTSGTVTKISPDHIFISDCMRRWHASLDDVQSFLNQLSDEGLIEFHCETNYMRTFSITPPPPEAEKTAEETFDTKSADEDMLIFAPTILNSTECNHTHISTWPRGHPLNG